MCVSMLITSLECIILFPFFSLSPSLPLSPFFVYIFLYVFMFVKPVTISRLEHIYVYITPIILTSVGVFNYSICFFLSNTLFPILSEDMSTGICFVILVKLFHCSWVSLTVDWLIIRSLCNYMFHFWTYLLRECKLIGLNGWGSESIHRLAKLHFSSFIGGVPSRQKRSYLTITSNTGAKQYLFQ